MTMTALILVMLASLVLEFSLQSDSYSTLCG